MNEEGRIATAPAGPRNDIAGTRTPEAVGAEIRNLTSAARYLNVYYAVEIGRRLTEAKEMVAHGEWLNWLKAETEFSQPTASRFMRVYAEYGADQGNIFGAETKYSTLNNLSVSNALRLLALPEEEREDFALEVDAEHLSAKELEEAIRERAIARASAEARVSAGADAISKGDQSPFEEPPALRGGSFEAAVDAATNVMTETIKELEATAKELEEAQRLADEETARAEASEKLRAELADEIAGKNNEIEAARKKIADLESRPIDVAIQEPDPAEIERRASEIAQAAGAEAEKQIRQLQADKAAAEAQVKAAEEKAKAERDKLREKLKAAEEKLAGAGAEDKAAADKLRGEVEALKKQLAMSDAALVTFKLRFQQWQESYAAMREAMSAVAEGQREKCEAAVKAVIAGWSA